MAIAEAYTGSSSISITEFSLTAGSTSLGAITTAGVYQTFIDFANMVAGDEYQIKIYEKVTSGGTQRLIAQHNLVGIQIGPFVSPSFVLLNGWEMTVKRISGADRTITWSIRKVA